MSLNKDAQTPMGSQNSPPNAKPDTKQSPSTVEDHLAQLIQVLNNQGQEAAIRTLSFPTYSYTTSFYDWAIQFQRVARAQLNLSDAQMIREATRRLDGLVGNIAEFIADGTPDDWRAFVGQVNRHLNRSQGSNRSQAEKLTLRQWECPEGDFDIYAFTKYKAILDSEPHYQHSEILPLLVAGLMDEYYQELAPKVRSGKITTFKDFVEAGNKLKRSMPRVVSARSCLAAPEHMDADDRAREFLYNLNYYAPKHPDLQQSGPQRRQFNNERNFHQQAHHNSNNFHQQSHPHSNNYRRNQNNYHNNYNRQSGQQWNSNGRDHSPASQSLGNDGEPVREHVRFEQDYKAMTSEGMPNWEKHLARNPPRQNQHEPPNRPQNRTQPNLMILPRNETIRPDWECFLERNWKPAEAEVLTSNTDSCFLALASNTEVSTQAIAGTSSDSAEASDDSCVFAETESSKQTSSESDSATVSETDEEPSDSEEFYEGSLFDETESWQSDFDEDWERDSAFASDEPPETLSPGVRKLLQLLVRQQIETTDSEWSSDHTATETETESTTATSETDQTQSEPDEPEQAEDTAESVVSEYTVTTRQTIRPLRRIHLLINGQSAYAVIDSASTSSFVSDKLVDRLSLQTREANGAPRFTGLNNTGVGKPESEVRVKFTLQTTANQTVHINTLAYIMHNLAHDDRIDALIGRNVIEEAGLDLCSKTGRPLPFDRRRDANANLLTEIEPTQVPETELAKKNQRVFEECVLPFGTVRIGVDLKPHERQQVLHFLAATKSAFSQGDFDIGCTDAIEHVIDTGDHPPVKSNPYPLRATERDEVMRQVNELLDKGIIRLSRSPYCSPVVCCKKKNGELRPCIDLRKLNSITMKDAYPMKSMDEIIASMSHAKYITGLDMRMAYNQVKIREEDRKKTAFSVGGQLFEFNRLCYGLCGAPATFTRLIDKVLGPVLGQNCAAYLDDVVLWNETFDEHMLNLARVITLLRDAGLKLNMAKCMIGLKEITFLGYRLSERGMTPDPENTRALLELRPPANKKDAMSVIGCLSFYRKFVPNFSAKSKPITDLFKESVPFEWGPKQDQAFEELKFIICNEPVLALFDPALEIEVRSDASGMGFGSVLVQKHPEGYRPVAFASRKLRGAEVNYSITDLEAAAVMFAVKKFEPYLLGRRFTIVTDHNALTFLQTKRPLSPRLTRYAMALQEHDFQIVYKSGRQNRDADALSRFPVEDDYRSVRAEEVNEEADHVNEEREFIYMTQPEPSERRRAGLFKFLQATCSGSPTTFHSVPRSLIWQRLGQQVSESAPTSAQRKQQPSTRRKRAGMQPVICRKCAVTIHEDQPQTLRQRLGPPVSIHSRLSPISRSPHQELWNLNVSKDQHSSAAPQRRPVPRAPLTLRATCGNRPVNFHQVPRNMLQQRPSKQTSKQTNKHERQFANKPTAACVFVVEAITQGKQARDPALQRIVKQLLELPKLSTKDRRKLESYRLNERRVLLKEDAVTGQERIVVPNDLRMDILLHYHSEPISAHPGVFGTYSKIAAKYYWVGLKNDVVKFVRACPVCNVIKPMARPARYPLKVIECDRPFQRIAIDVMGPYKKHDNRTPLFIIVAIDYFTKWLELRVVERNTSEEMTKFLVQQIFLRHGAPSELITDQGRPLISIDFRSICAALGIAKLQTTASHAASNGAVERANGVVKKVLRALRWSNTRWWENLDLAAFAINTTPNSSTHYSPFYLVYNRKPNLPLDITLEENVTEAHGSYNEYVDLMEKRWKQAKEVALLNNRIARDSYKKYYDRSQNAVPFKIGDLVLREAPYTPAVQDQRFRPKYIGPYRIVKFISTYVLQLKKEDDPTAKPVITHVTKLKPFTASTNPPTNSPSTVAPQVLATVPLDSEDSDPEVFALTAKQRAARKRAAAARRKKTGTVQRVQRVKRKKTAKERCLESVIGELIKRANKPKRVSRKKKTAGAVSSRAPSPRPSTMKRLAALEKRVDELEILCEQLKKPQVNQSNLAGREKPTPPTLPANTGVNAPAGTSTNAPANAPASATGTTTGSAQSDAPTNTAAGSQPPAPTVLTTLGEQIERVKYVVMNEKMKSVTDIPGSSGSRREVFQITKDRPSDNKIEAISLMDNRKKVLVRNNPRVKICDYPLYVAVRSAGENGDIMKPGSFYMVDTRAEGPEGSPKWWYIVGLDKFGKTDHNGGTIQPTWERISRVHQTYLCPIRPSVYDLKMA